ncbi:M23 family metallopeptidase [Ideonella sp. BN130291]|uniref:M23 family metallopeptidase n=1 Tax=Ideonella sp. BN130291 TaxID=3112940 RepID=UPI002E26771E|nr:M23 family metallopeptidase [Ideonella sp. BN130291]
MSFVMIATGATSCSQVRTLSVRALLTGGALAALLLLGTGAALGYWLAPASAPATQQLAAQERPHAALPFALEQLGALSGRLFRLESEAAQLSKRIGVLKKDKPTEPAKAPGSGGPMLPPVADLDALDEQLARIEQQIALVSDATSEHHLDVMRQPSRWPIPGADMVSTFGNREDPFTHHKAFHSGIDFAAQAGTPIHATAGGTVAFAGFRPDFGWMVEIDHGNGLSTRYAHASRLLVKAGAVVAPGEQVATVGSTGRSTGPHLHYEVLRHGGHLDPRAYLASR